LNNSDFEESERDRIEFEQKIADYHALVNRVFTTEDGKQLLDVWVKDHVFSPTIIPGQPLEYHGIREGKAAFVRDICEVLDLITNNYYQQENSNE